MDPDPDPELGKFKAGSGSGSGINSFGSTTLPYWYYGGVWGFKSSYSHSHTHWTHILILVLWGSVGFQKDPTCPVSWNSWIWEGFWFPKKQGWVFRKYFVGSKFENRKKGQLEMCFKNNFAFEKTIKSKIFFIEKTEKVNHI